MTATVLARKVAEVRARVARVRELLPSTLDAFLAERLTTEALLFNLYLALQTCSDLALHVVADRGLGVAGDARSAYELLSRAGVLDPALATRLAAAVGLRNRIAHSYGGLDLSRVYMATRSDLGDLDSFAAAVAKSYGI